MRIRERVRNTCWASPITYAGGGLGLTATYELARSNYVSAAAAAAGSAIADLFDGIEARRFKRRQPEKAEKRSLRGKLEDQLWDKVRNVGILGVLAFTHELPNVTQVTAGAAAARELGTLVGGAIIATKHYMTDKRVPEALPSSPLGKETMAWLGGGTVASIASLAVAQHNPALAHNLATTGEIFLTCGFVRGIQSSWEYITAGRDWVPGDPMPEYKPHLGQVVMGWLRRSNEASSNHPE